MIHRMVLALSLVFAIHAQALDHMHSDWTQVLKSYLDQDGMFRYQKLKADIDADKSHKFLTYLGELERVQLADYKKLTPDQQKAFLINAYNAFTVKLIVDHYPVKSIKDIGGFFKRPWSIKFFSLLEGKIQSLDPIEHEWLRPQFKDYRIHAAVNCASISCPPLRKRAFTGKDLSAQLDEQMQVWLNDETRNRVDLKSKKVHISKIFDWYEKDFVQWGGGLLQVVFKYHKSKLPISAAKDFEVEFLDYDWGLNESK